MESQRQFVERAIERDLFGPEGLGEPLAAPPKYQLIRPLGRGGFGVVWLAHDRELERPVALKFLTHALPADVERFRREARYAARLNDPALVQVYEMGEAGGRPFIAMQYIDGKNLGESALEPTALVKALRSVAVALQHAHAQGIVHRDIKPQNILLDREGRAYLTDFGIARDLKHVSGATLNPEGLVIGTPSLMPPEQAAGLTQEIDARSDVYALGATLFLMLTDRAPFDGPGVIDILHAVIHIPPPFPRSIRATIPRSLEAITLKCLQKNKADRYGSMTELVEDLDLFLAGLPVKSGSAAWFRKLVGAPPPKPVAPGADPLVPAVLEIAREIAEWDATLYRISSNICKTYGRIDSILDRLDRMLSARPDFAFARFYRGVALSRRGRLEEALEEMERSIDRVGEMAGAQFELGCLCLGLYLRDDARARRHISVTGVTEHLETARGRLAPAVVAFQEAQRLKEDLALWQIEYARAVERLARNDFDGCVAVCDEILSRDADIELVWKLRGDALRFAGRDPIESYDRAVLIRRSFYEALFAKAEAQAERRAFTEARASLERALEICPDFVDAMALAARTYLLEGAHEQAVAYLGKALERNRDHYETVMTNAELLIEIGQVDLALEALERAKKLDGCGHRVEYLSARARLERARHLPGPEARKELAELIALGEEWSKRLADNEAWIRLVNEARKSCGS